MNEIQISNLVDDVINYREDPSLAHEMCFNGLLDIEDLERKFKEILDALTVEEVDEWINQDRIEQKKELLTTAMDTIQEVYLAQNN